MEKRCRVALYGVWNFHLGHGIIGGMMTSGEHQGKTAVGMIKRVLDGDSVLGMPLVKVSPNQYMFDRKVIGRFGMTIIDLPAGSILINQP